MTDNIFVLKGDLNGENRSGAFLFFCRVYIKEDKGVFVTEYLNQSIYSHVTYRYLKINLFSVKVRDE